MSSRWWIIFCCVLLIVIIPQGAAGREKNKPPTAAAKECTVSEVLHKRGAALGAKVTMNRNIQDKIPCDDKYGKDMDEVIKKLLFHESNYAVVWRHTDKGVASVDIRFFEGSKKDYSPPGAGMTAMPAFQGERTAESSLASLAGADEKAGSGDAKEIDIEKIAPRIPYGGRQDNAGMTAVQVSAGGQATEVNPVNVDETEGEGKISPEKMAPDLQNAGRKIIMPVPRKQDERHFIFPVPRKQDERHFTFPPAPIPAG